MPTARVLGSHDPRLYQGQSNNTCLQLVHTSPVTAFCWPEQLLEEWGLPHLVLTRYPRACHAESLNDSVLPEHMTPLLPSRCVALKYILVICEFDSVTVNSQICDLEDLISYTHIPTVSVNPTTNLSPHRPYPFFIFPRHFPFCDKYSSQSHLCWFFKMKLYQQHFKNSKQIIASLVPGHMLINSLKTLFQQGVLTLHGNCVTSLRLPA